MSESNFTNSTLFILPLWFNQLTEFSTTIQQDSRWEPFRYDPGALAYFLPHVSRLAGNEDLLRTYRLQRSAFPNMYLHQDTYGERITLKEIRLSCFETGIGFFEILVDYVDMSLQEICDFSYDFKKSYKPDQYEKYQTILTERGLISAKKAAEALLPAGTDLFFYTTADFKKEFLTFQMIRTDAGTIPEAEIGHWTYGLAHSYNQHFAFSEDPGDGRRHADNDFEMIYQPFLEDNWAGCLEGLANLTIDPGENWYINNKKKPQLVDSYRLLYLLLLNQRFASIKYIELVADAARGDKGIIIGVNDRIIKLEAAFSFRIVSNDIVYQSVYSRMYRLMDIDSLRADMKDNEMEVDRMLRQDEENAVKNRELLLFTISILSIASFLIDATNYIEYLAPLNPFAPWISLGILVIGILVLVYNVFYMYRRKKRE